MRKLPATTALGLGCIVFALVLAFVWIPLDTETWFVERKRGRYIVGDSLAPTLADTAPWKYIGFGIGGGTMIFCMISFVEQRITWRALWVALAAVIGIIVLYDLPFDDVLLPPNGDV